ncbi:MAG: HD domain-containing phosphohydrolase [Clostridia bacterium]
MELPKLKILAIDDNLDNLTTIKALVRAMLPSAEVYTATNGRKGIALALVETPDVILLDIFMPEMDGFEVCQIMKKDETLKIIPVLFLTAANAERTLRIKAIEAGAEAFLCKPIDEIELMTQIQSMAKIKASTLAQLNEKERLLSLVEQRTYEIDQELKMRKQMVVFAEELLKSESEQVTFQKILENLLYISKAKYGVLNLQIEETGKFTTVALAGINGKIQKATDLLGFQILGKEWAEYDYKSDRLTKYFVTRFSSMTELAGKVIPKVFSKSLEKMFDMGEVIVLKIMVNQEMIGDFTLIMPHGKNFENEYFVEIYARQVDMFFSRIRAKERIEFLSFHDHLTGLHNRRYYDAELERMDQEMYVPLVLAMVDVNGLKLTNDAFGHKIGDQLLAKVADILKKECRDEDFVARVGGDEFVLLLPKTDADYAEKIIERINQAISKEKINNVTLSVSIGYAVRQKMTEDINEIFKRAEDDMYKHKLSESMSMRSNTIELIMRTLFEKSNREMLHSKRVSSLCVAIAEELALNKDEINQLRTAGLMHDIGKIGIDENILNKDSSLQTMEWNEIVRHPEIGYRILSSVNEFSEIAEFVLSHHERWDGTGYPRGLIGEKICLQARIIAVADAFDAMTSDRPYRKALNIEEAVLEIKKNAATQFDPNIAGIFIEKVLNKQPVNDEHV